jgi:hypothetical protein
MKTRLSLVRFRGRSGSTAEHEPAEVAPAEGRPAPQTWNVWELERIAEETNGGDLACREERLLLVRHLREFANAGGDLPLEFDPLVREAFGADLALLVAPRG